MLKHTDTAWKVSKYGIFSGPYFPAFGLNTERYGVSMIFLQLHLRRRLEDLSFCIRPMFPSYRNQPVDLQSKTTDWFLYYGNIGRQRAIREQYNRYLTWTFCPFPWIYYILCPSSKFRTHLVYTVQENEVFNYWYLQ